ncbi:MAG: bifunctional glycosyltransferase family 2/GtrA family protein [Ancrocorticia sp.]|jgi:glycosyltransferase involved in cell wall biosynthesis|nr:bifunctional glycosyltransferase family 2/GtrA family protein [Ancrocorticia sp.]
MIILIPAFEPTHTLPGLVEALLRELPDADVLVVDDGSGPAYLNIFRDAARSGAYVIGYTANHGKGFALRTGIRWVIANRPTATVVCADSDGQHRPEDIARVAATARGNPAAIVLGSRAFTHNVPWRSRFGNTTSALFFRLASGRKLSDTQTGLRAYSPHEFAWLLTVSGDRFEWEFNVLLSAARAGRSIVEVPIATVYLNHNAGSHFRPIVDSFRVFRPLLAFMATGIGCWALELAAFLLLQSRIGIPLAVVLSRIGAAAVNFAINKHAVFRDGHPVRRQIVQYALLALFLMAFTTAGVEALSTIGVPMWLAKTLTDLCGFAISYAVQSRTIFAPRENRPQHVPGVATHARDVPGASDTRNKRLVAPTSTPQAPLHNPVP